METSFFSKLDDLLKGRPADFAGSEISTDEVQDFLLGRRRDVGSTSRSIFKKAVFRTKLDLSDGRRLDGSPLPAMEFHNCTFHEGFCADGAHLERLRFFCCQFVAEQNVNNVLWPEPEECRHSTEYPAKIHKLRKPKNCISLRHCRVETELRIELLKPHDWAGEPGVLTMDAFAARVGTNVHISDTVLRAQRGESSTLSEEAHYALHLATATIGGDLQLWPNVVLEGGLKMRDAQIGGSLWASGLQVTDGEDSVSRNTLIAKGHISRYAFWLDTTDVQGNVVLSSSSGQPFRADGVVTVMNATIVGALYLEAEISDSLILLGATIKGALVINGAVKVIEGSQLTVQGGLGIGCRQLRTCKLTGAMIGDTLDVSKAEFHGPYFPEPRVIAKSQSLKCYKDAVYAEILFFKDAISPLFLVSFLILHRRQVEGDEVPAHSADKKEERIILLNGTSGPLHALNAARLDRLSLDTEQEAREYLILFCASVWGEEGSFAIIFDEEALPKTDSHFTIDPERVRVPVMEKEQGWLAIAYVRYADLLFEVDFSISKSGNVEMSDDRPIAKYPVGTNTQRGFTSPYRWVSLDEFKRYRSDVLGSLCAFEPVQMIPPQDLIDCVAALEQTKAAFTPSVDLTSAACKQLNDWSLDVSALREGKEPGFSRKTTYNLTWPRDTSLQEFDYRQLSIMDEESDAKRLSWVRHFVAPPESDRQARLYFLLTLMLIALLAAGALEIAIVWPWPKLGSLSDVSSRHLASRFVISFLALLPFALTGVLLWRRGYTAINWTTVNSVVRKSLAAFQWRALFAFLWAVLRVIAEHLWTPESSRFLAQPYAHLAMVLRQRGDEDSARRVEAEKMWQEAVSRGKLQFHHWLAKHLMWRPYRVMFNFGLSSERAFWSIVIFWFMGWASVFLLSDSGMLRSSVTRVAPAVLMEANSFPKPAVEAVYKDRIDGAEADYSCAEDIEPALYSFELMTPVLNLHQESRCEIRSKPAANGKTVQIDLRMGRRHLLNLPVICSYGWFWEYAKALYMLLGSIIMSLAILTFSGVARRWDH